MDYLTPEEVLKVLKIAQSESQRDYCMILFAYSHGLRASEVCSLKLSEIKSETLTIQRLKGSNKTIQPLVRHKGIPILDEIKAIKIYLQIRPKDAGDALFPSNKGGCLTGKAFWRIYKYYAQKSGLPKEKQHPHALKHSTANTLIRNGADIAHVQQYLGHAEIGSTMKYINISDQESSEKAQNAFMNAF